MHKLAAFIAVFALACATSGPTPPPDYASIRGQYDALTEEADYPLLGDFQGVWVRRIENVESKAQWDRLPRDAEIFVPPGRYRLHVRFDAYDLYRGNSLRDMARDRVFGGDEHALDLEVEASHRYLVRYHRSGRLWPRATYWIEDETLGQPVD